MGKLTQASTPVQSNIQPVVFDTIDEVLGELESMLGQRYVSELHLAFIPARQQDGKLENITVRGAVFNNPEQPPPAELSVVDGEQE